MRLTKIIVIQLRFIRNDKCSEMKIRIREKIIHNLYVVVCFCRRNGIPFQFAVRFQSIPGLNPPQFIKNFQSFFFRTPNTSQPHRLDAIVFQMATFITIYIIVLVHFFLNFLNCKNTQMKNIFSAICRKLSPIRFLLLSLHPLHPLHHLHQLLNPRHDAVCSLRRCVLGTRRSRHSRGRGG